MAKTKIVKVKDDLINCELPGVKELLHRRTMTADEWIEQHASGTVRKNKRVGMAFFSQYIEERVCWDFGWEFEAVPRSRLEWGDAMSEGDCHAVTEAGWHIDRYMSFNSNCMVLGDKVECAHISVEYENGTAKKGIGMVVRETNAKWIPKGHTVFCIVAEYDEEKGEWKNAVNP